MTDNMQCIKRCMAVTKWHGSKLAREDKEASKFISSSRISRIVSQIVLGRRVEIQYSFCSLCYFLFFEPNLGAELWPTFNRKVYNIGLANVYDNVSFLKGNPGWNLGQNWGRLLSQKKAIELPPHRPGAFRPPTFYFVSPFASSAAAAAAAFVVVGGGCDAR